VAGRVVAATATALAASTALTAIIDGGCCVVRTAATAHVTRGIVRATALTNFRNGIIRTARLTHFRHRIIGTARLTDVAGGIISTATGKSGRRSCGNGCNSRKDH